MADVKPKDDSALPVLLLLAVLWFARGGQLPNVVAPSGAERATYVYEQRAGALPPPVMSGLNRLNRERKILATALDVDVTDGSGNVPDQYKQAFETARQAGLPTLVVEGGGKVLRTVKAPTTEEQVWESGQ